MSINSGLASSFSNLKIYFDQEALEKLKIQKLLDFSANPIFVKEFDYKVTENYIYNDFFLNDATYDSSLMNHIILPCTEFGAINMQEFTVLLFDGTGNLVDKDEYKVRYNQDGLNIFRNKYYSKDPDLVMVPENNLKHTVVLIKKFYYQEVPNRFFTTVASDGNDQIIVSDVDLDPYLGSKFDGLFPVVYQRPDIMTPFSVVPNSIVDLSRADSGLYQFALKGYSTAGTQYCVMNGLEFHEVDFKYFTADNETPLFTFREGFLNSKEDLILSESENVILRIPLVTTFGTTKVPLPVIASKDIILFVDGKMLIPEKDFFITQREGENIALTLNWGSFPKGEHRVRFIINSIKNNKDYFVEELPTNRLLYIEEYGLKRLIGSGNRYHRDSSIEHVAGNFYSASGVSSLELLHVLPSLPVYKGILEEYYKSQANIYSAIGDIITYSSTIRNEYMSVWIGENYSSYSEPLTIPTFRDDPEIIFDGEFLLEDVLSGRIDGFIFDATATDFSSKFGLDDQDVIIDSNDDSLIQDVFLNSNEKDFVFEPSTHDADFNSGLITEVDSNNPSGVETNGGDGDFVIDSNDTTLTKDVLLDANEDGFVGEATHDTNFDNGLITDIDSNDPNAVEANGGSGDFVIDSNIDTGGNDVVLDANDPQPEPTHEEVFNTGGITEVDANSTSSVEANGGSGDFVIDSSSNNLENDVVLDSNPT